MKANTLSFLGLLTVAHVAFAHDSWLIADRNRVNQGESVWLSFVTGEVFPLGEAATDPARVESFVDWHGDQPTAIAGLRVEDRGLSVRRPLKDCGMHVIGLALRPRRLELEADVFESYLREERADQALSALARIAASSPANKSRQVEEYTKFAKTIVEVQPADPADKSYEAALGHRLEIIPLSNPCRWKAPQTVEVRVLLDGHAWPDVAVSCGREGLGSHAAAVRTRTNGKGVASIKLDKPGHWYIKAHLIREKPEISHCRWESFWATLTFRVLGETDVQGALQSIRGLHGRLELLAVVGYRMGLRAMAELGLEKGSDDLVAVHRTPAVPCFAAAADGVAAATGASLGRLNLQIEKVSDAADVVVIFTRRSTGQRIAFEPAPDVIRECLEYAADLGEEAALRAATLPDEALFAISRKGGSLSPSASLTASRLSARAEPEPP